jgi:hypothetical protein
VPHDRVEVVEGRLDAPAGFVVARESARALQ